MHGEVVYSAFDGDLNRRDTIDWRPVQRCVSDDRKSRQATRTTASLLL